MLYTGIGHAGYAEAGSDIVCAGISALWGVLGLLPDVSTQHIDSEQISRIQGLSGHADAVLPIMDAVARAMREMAKQYPEYVEFIESRAGLS